MPQAPFDRPGIRVPMVRVSFSAALFGLLYGVVCRALFDDTLPGVLEVAFPAMSIAFLFVVPLAIGALTVTLTGDPRSRVSPLYWILAPWVPSTALVLTVFVLAWEGAICLVMAAPLLFGLASVGGVLAGWVVRRRTRAAQPLTAGLALLPFMLGPLEARLPPPADVRTVETQAVIAADAASVWREVVRVPAITPAEQRGSFFHWIGIPRPHEATLDHDGLGGLREARFHGGILFRERITEWEPRRTLGFGIEVVPESVGADVLDQHVRVGGEHFDVLYGRFDLEPLGPHATRLRLVSRHRLQTRFNAYAGLWSDAVMRDLQAGICGVIKDRSEAAAR